jgi:mycoredoxin
VAGSVVCRFGVVARNIGIVGEVGVQVTTEVLVHVRPGCPFCDMLRANLKRSGLKYRELDIWQDPDAAAAVRAAANGNETVPTVNVGNTWMVNPSIHQVLAAVKAEAPELLPQQ